MCGYEELVRSRLKSIKVYSNAQSDDVYPSHMHALTCKVYLQWQHAKFWQNVATSNAGC